MAAQDHVGTGDLRYGGVGLGEEDILGREARSARIVPHTELGRADLDESIPGLAAPASIGIVTGSDVTPGGKVIVSRTGWYCTPATAEATGELG